MELLRRCCPLSRLPVYKLATVLVLVFRLVVVDDNDDDDDGNDDNDVDDNNDDNTASSRRKSFILSVSKSKLLFCSPTPTKIVVLVVRVVFIVGIAGGYKLDEPCPNARLFMGAITNIDINIKIVNRTVQEKF